jgi:hypothetical protein
MTTNDDAKTGAESDPECRVYVLTQTAGNM